MHSHGREGIASWRRGALALGTRLAHLGVSSLARGRGSRTWFLTACPYHSALPEVFTSKGREEESALDNVRVLHGRVHAIPLLCSLSLGRKTMEKMSCVKENDEN